MQSQLQKRRSVHIDDFSNCISADYFGCRLQEVKLNR
jgi:hypothetical protein